LTCHYVIIDYEVHICGGQPLAGDDALELRWFDTQALQDANVSDKTRELLKSKFGF